MFAGQHATTSIHRGSADRSDQNESPNKRRDTGFVVWTPGLGRESETRHWDNHTHDIAAVHAGNLCRRTGSGPPTPYSLAKQIVSTQEGLVFTVGH